MPFTVYTVSAWFSLHMIEPYWSGLFPCSMLSSWAMVCKIWIFACRGSAGDRPHGQYLYPYFSFHVWLDILPIHTLVSLSGQGWWGWLKSSFRIAPVIAAALYLPGIYLAFQSISVYLSLSYPKYQGSIFAGNALLWWVFSFLTSWALNYSYYLTCTKVCYGKHIPIVQDRIFQKPWCRPRIIVVSWDIHCSDVCILCERCYSVTPHFKPQLTCKRTFSAPSEIWWQAMHPFPICRGIAEFCKPRTALPQTAFFLVFESKVVLIALIILSLHLDMKVICAMFRHVHTKFIHLPIFL